MEKYYSAERSTQMLVYLMKAHNIKKVVVSPGMKNYCFVGSIQNDPFFELYSCADEKSAAYMAVGLAEASGEPVALSCTGATASRNYMSALTEAYYNKLPILAVTSMTHVGEIGQLIPQIIDRRTEPTDIIKYNAQIPMVKSNDDEWSNNVLMNAALLELTRHGGGPVLINLTTECSWDFSVKTLPETRVIKRVGYEDEFPELEGKQVGIFIGNHREFSKELTELIEKFCEKYNGVVICDQSSNYRGKYAVYPAVVTHQKLYPSPLREMDLMIHIGQISGAYIKLLPEKVWRVDEDGEVRDTFRKLSKVFEMSDKKFFETYVKKAENKADSQMEYYKEWEEEIERIRVKIPELPFSNAWIAKNMMADIPDGSYVNFGILNTLRNWNFVDGKDIHAYANTGGFGIDGIASTTIGASFQDKNRLCFGIMGDLAFFYDINSIGNRHVGNNVRILVVNNGLGVEFRNYGHPANEFGEEADKYMAAGGHNGHQSRDLLKNYAEALGFEYMSAATKEEFLEAKKTFVNKEITDKPMLFEVFTNTEDESQSLMLIETVEKTLKATMKKTIKKEKKR